MDAIRKAIAGKGSTFEEQWRKFIVFCRNQETVNDLTRLYASVLPSFNTAPSDPAKNIGEDLALSLTNCFAAANHAVGPPACIDVVLPRQVRRRRLAQRHLRQRAEFRPVDVTNVPWIAICRDNPAGRVEEVVFMVGNGEVDRGDPN